MHDDDDDRQAQTALCRYQMISGYLALDPPRGQRRQLLEELAAKTWAGPDGEPLTAAAETLRTWLRRYRRGGLDALRDKPRTKRGVQVLTADEVDTVLALKREVPARSLDRLIQIAEGMKLVKPNVLRRSTVHRLLQQEGISGRPAAASSRKDLDRFEAERPNELWQSDMLVGPWLPDPDRPGKARRAYLYAFIDDHSRMLLHGRFSFTGELPGLELVMRRCLQKYGKPARVYYDNGKVYRSGHMRHIVATLGIHAIVFTTAYRPEGHGKIEAFNRLCRSSFLAELAVSGIRTLDELNEAFVAWADVEYNRRTHSELGQSPRDRFAAGNDRIEYLDEAKLRLAFRWKEFRTPDKAGVFSLFGTRYQVGPELARRRIEVYYDPEQLDEVQVHHNGQFAERCTPFEVRRHRRPKPAVDAPAPEASPANPTANWLDHLIRQRRSERFLDPAEPSDASADRDAADDDIVALLRDRLDGDVFDESAVRAFLARYGPLDGAHARQTLDSLLEADRSDHHIHVYLDAIRRPLP